MTVKEILQNAYSISGQFVSDTVGIRYINNAVSLLIHRYETAMNMEKETINVENNTYEPDGLMGLKRILKNGSPYKGYKVQEGTIAFNQNGEFELHYYTLPMEVESEHDEPDINVFYHPILELYVAAKIPKPSDRDLEQEFSMLADEIDSRIKRQAGRIYIFQQEFGGNDMTYKDVIDLTFTRVGEDPSDVDPEELPIVKSAINQAYMILRSSADQRTSESTMPYEVPIVLSSTIGDIVDVIHSKDGRLGVNEYTRATDLLYVFSPLRKGDINIKHVELPPALSGNDDIIDLKELFIPALSAYAAYSYQLYRRKYAAAQLLLSEFESYTGQSTTQPIPEEGGN